MPHTDPRFGQLQACGCPATVWQHEAKLTATLAEFRSELGLLGECRLDTFDLSRPPATMGGPERQSLTAALHACQSYVASIDHHADWLYLCGPVGSGKSHLAAGVAWELSARGLAVVYRSVPDLVDALRAGYRTGDYDDRMEAIKQAPVLVLDDLGAEAESARPLLFQIIEYRARTPTRTLVTSNLLPKQLEQLDPRIASRIFGRARIIPVIAPDYRRLPRGP